jgi:transposase
MSEQASTPNMGLTTKEVAKLFRVSPDKVRAWIAKGELLAINTANVMCGKPRFVVLPHQLAEFEARRQATSETVKTLPRRKKRTGEIDYYP